MEDTGYQVLVPNFHLVSGRVSSGNFQDKEVGDKEEVVDTFFFSFQVVNEPSSSSTSLEH